MHRVVDEIENSEVMWLGVSKGMLGYEADGEVTVRSEVARLTRLYDRAVKTNTMNNPEIYSPSGGAEGTPGRTRPPLGHPRPPVPLPATATSSAPAPVPAPDPDESPATKAKPTPPPPPPPPSTEAPKDDKKGPSAKDSKSNHAQTPHADAPGPPPRDTAKPAAEPTAGAGDDILDDPSNPTIHVQLTKTAAKGSSS
jgi:hypothetical protein